MPNWNETLAEIQEEVNRGNNAALDTIRGKYLRLVAEKTGRNTIAYYSGWLQKSGHEGVIINDKDKSAFMANIHRMDRTKGLDLILHTPGGDLAATESLVDYLFAMFGNDVRAIIPQISMSAGTMIALSCKEIMLGKQSNLGPIDPQMGGIACQAVIDEFETAKKDVRENPHSAALWQVIIAKYHPTFIGSCKYAIEWSEQLVLEWLERNMCLTNKKDAARILREFSDHPKNKSHARHISKDQCKAVGVKVVDMESDQDLQDYILTVHHAFMHTFNHSGATKIVENNLGMIYVEQTKQQS
jgi:ATP-dependent protease ClpP protease subunit